MFTNLQEKSALKKSFFLQYMFIKIVLIFVLSCTINVAQSDVFMNLSSKNFPNMVKEQTFKSIFFNISPQNIYVKRENKRTKNFIHALFHENQISHIENTYEDQMDVVVGEQKLTIEKIKCRGNKFLNLTVLRKKLEKYDIRVGSMLNEKNILLLKRDLYRFYYFFGRYNAKVSIELEILPYDNVSINLTLYEGDQFKVHEIKIFGNNNFCSKKLKNLFSLNDTKKSWKKSGYREDNLNSDLQKLKSFYVNNGYIRFKIDHAWINLTEDKGIYINVRVKEGNQYKLDKIEFYGKINSYLKRLNQLIDDISYNSTFQEEKVSTVQKKIENFFRSCGYIGSIIKIVYRIDDVRNTVRIIFNIDTGERYYVKKIEFSGNSSIKNEILQKKIPQIEGKPINMDLVRVGQMNLVNTDLFEKVGYSIIFLPNLKNQVKIIYRVIEPKFNAVNFGVGVGKENGVNYHGNVQKKNCLGVGNSIKFSVFRNDDLRKIDLFFSNPRYIQDKVGLRSRMFYDSSIRRHSLPSLYDQRTFHFNTSFSFPIVEKNILDVGVEITDNRIFNMDPQLHIWRYLMSIKKDSVILNDQIHYEVKDVSLNIGWNLEDLDDDIFPRSGKKISVKNKFSIFNINNQYFKSTLDFKKYFPIDLKKRWIFSFRTILGLGDSRNDFPFYENFHASGENIIRGFRSDTVGPKSILLKINRDGSICPKPNSEKQRSTGGNFMTMNILELIFPEDLIFSEKFHGNTRASFFVDSGTVRKIWRKKVSEIWNEEALNLEETDSFKVSTGISLRWLSPIGPLTFSYSIPIKYLQKDKFEKFQFNVGKTW
ncbi:hypothetical protein AOQ87_01090 [Candidatus Riesia pediculischaeffi]|uniref:Outer membrane protein assembly factor BamA n=2 Tax=Candidatus Riesia pediculischaeffi TaxID=428411 RepID=A0A1V0HKC5_9ENTR|nr:hypothetical protein AOQ87_01090 [Candidatus Riesia pediculischaeffi]